MLIKIIKLLIINLFIIISEKKKYKTKIKCKSSVMETEQSYSNSISLCVMKILIIS